MPVMDCGAHPGDASRACYGMPSGGPGIRVGSRRERSYSAGWLPLSAMTRSFASRASIDAVTGKPNVSKTVRIR